MYYQVNTYIDRVCILFLYLAIFDTFRCLRYIKICETHFFLLASEFESYVDLNIAFTLFISKWNKTFY